MYSSFTFSVYCFLIGKKKKKKRKVRKKTNDEILRNTRREIHTFKPYKRNR